MKKGIRNSIIVGIVSTLICSIGIGVFVQKNNTLKLSKEDIGEKQAMTETKEFTEDDYPYNIKFKDIAVGYYFAVAIDEEGYLWTWGQDGDPNNNKNLVGTLGDGSKESSRVYPKRITKNKYSKIYASGCTAFAIDEEGYLYGWGYNDNNQLGNTNEEEVSSPLPIKSNLYFSTVTTSGQNMAAIDENGEIWVCGVFASSVNTETGKKYKDPTNISSKTNTKFIDVATTDTSLAAIDENGNIWTWGYNGETFAYGEDEDRYNYGLLANNKETIGRKFVGLKKVTTDIVYTEIDAGREYIIAKDNNKHLWSWGNNNCGQLGQGNKNIYSVPTLITNKRAFNEFYANDSSFIAIDTNKDVWACGYNEGQFGGSSNRYLTSITKLDSDHKYIKCAISSGVSLILDEKGVLYGARTFRCNSAILGHQENTRTYTQITNPNAGYKVTFMDGENTIDTQTVEEGQSATAPSLTKTGYTLSWDKAFNNVTSDLTVNAVWTPNTYTVTLNTNDGTINSGNVTNYTYGVGATLPTNVTKEGHTFGGWYDNSGCTGTAVTSISNTDIENKTYYAKWTINTYTVTFKNGDSVLKTETVNYGTGATVPSPVPTKVGYTLNWDKAFNNVTSDLTVNAVWTANTNTAYKVEHYKQGENGYTLEETDNQTGTTDTIATATAKTYAGYTENTSITERIPSGVIAGDGSLVLKLYYDRNLNTAYKVEHYKQGENGYTLEETDNQTGTTDTTATATAKTYAGYTENTSITERVPSGVIVGDGSLVLKLYYDRNLNTKYTVKHYKQQGKTTTYTLAETENLTAPTDTIATAQPKTYVGYEENTTAQERVPSGVVLGDGSLELVLIYDTIKHTVTFKDGENIVDTQTVVYGENAVEPNITKPGYTLTWDKEFSNITSDITVNAIWTANEGIAYKVEHYQQNTDLTTYTLAETDNRTGTTNTNVTAVAKQYQGFSENQTHTERVASGIVLGDGSLTLKLYYDRNNYAVNLNKNGGTINEGNVLQYTYGIGAILPTNVTKEGYVFRGWYQNEQCEGEAITAIGTQDIGTKIYYAKWLKDTDGDGIPDIEDNDTQVPYKIEHYIQNTDLETYTLKETTDKKEGTEDKLTGNLGSTVTAVAKQYKGFSENTEHQDRKPSGEVVVDGSLTLKLYYDRETYQITYETNGGTIEDENYATEYTYGIPASLPTNVTKLGYTFGGWYEGEEKTIISQTNPEDIGDKTYKANWIAKGDTPYKVEHYKQVENGYTLEETDPKTAATDIEVTAIPKTYEGYIENQNHEERKASGKVVGDGSLVLKLYYDKITYQVTFKDEGTIIKTQTINHGEGAEAPTPTKEGYVLRWDKEYSKITSELEVNAIWLRDTDGDGIPDIEDDETLVDYIIRHYKQQGKTQQYTLAETETKQAQLGTTVTAEAKEYEGYIENTEVIERIPSGEITGEENLELRLFYDTIKYEITFKDGDQEIEKQEVPHGGKAEAPALTKEGYVLRWDKELENITEEQTINTIWLKDTDGDGIPDIEDDDTKITYKVEHYVPTKEGKYNLKETEKKQGQLGSQVTAQAKPYEEYEIDETNKNTIKEGKIEEEKELVLKLYYKYKKYTVIFKDGDKEVGRVEVNYGEKAEPPELTKPGYILSWDKNINNITKEETIVAVWTKDPNYKDPDEGKDDNATINKIPNDGKDDKRPSILPKTGEETVTLVGIVVLIGLSIVYFVKYRNKTQE